MTLPHSSITGRRLAHLLAALLLLGACGSGASGGGTSVTGVPFTASDGQRTTIADFHGTPVVVNLWATWCTPCVAEMPAFDQVAGTQAGVAIIGVNVGDTAAAATAFAADLGVTYPQYTDPDGQLSTALHATGYPATAFFSADGTLLELHQGALTADELRAAISRHFAETTTEGTST